MKQAYINNQMMIDPTPDITPTTVREAIAEERERGRREDRAGAISNLRFFCRMKRDGEEDSLAYQSQKFGFDGVAYADPCEALRKNGIPLDPPE